MAVIFLIGNVVRMECVTSFDSFDCLQSFHIVVRFQKDILTCKNSQFLVLDLFGVISRAVFVGVGGFSPLHEVADPPSHTY